MKQGIVVTMVAAIAIGSSSVTAIATTEVKPYAVSIQEGSQVTPLLSVADNVEETDNPQLRYQMVGIPDGLGLTKNGSQATIYMNHEFATDKTAETTIGAQHDRGAVVSSWTVDRSGNVLSGRRAYDTVYAENTLVGAAPDTTNQTPPFARFCSGSTAGRGHRLTQKMYFSGEESEGAATFDGRGGQAVVVFDNEIHTLPKMGHFSKENVLIMKGTGQRTVAMVMEDGPATPDSQLYMYVGRKNPKAETVLGRNGLDNGKLYTYVGSDPSKNSELNLQEGSTTGNWVEIPGAGTMSDVELEAAADAAGAFAFVRIEDGAFSKTQNGTFFFDTTGGNKDAGNELGRLYRLGLNPTNPTAPSPLTILYNADRVIAGGGDIAISPDNLDTSKTHLMVQEDGTTQSRAVMGSKGRDGSIWSFPITSNGRSVDAGAAERVVELDPPGRDGTEVGPGVWETSGIIDASRFFGPRAWLFDVQAHPPTTPPGNNTIEDGQLLLLRT